MDWKELDTIIEKYYDGTTTLDEERTVRLFFESAEAIPEKYKATAELFKVFKLEAEVHHPETITVFKDKRKLSIWKFAGLTGIAASICLIIIFTIINYQPKAIDQIAEVTYAEQKKAYYQTKEALLIVSENLNRGKKEINRLTIFNEVQKTILKN